MGKLKVMRQVLAADTNKRQGFLLDAESWSYMVRDIWFTFSERHEWNRTSCPGDIVMLTWTSLSLSLVCEQYHSVQVRDTERAISFLDSFF